MRSRDAESGWSPRHPAGQRHGHVVCGGLSASRQLVSEDPHRFRRVLGEDHPDTLSAASLLGIALWSLGEYQQARQLLSDTFTRSRWSLARTTPSRCARPSSSASPCARWASISRPRQLQSDAFTRIRRHLGEDHPVTLGSGLLLGGTLESLGQQLADSSRFDIFPRSAESSVRTTRHTAHSQPPRRRSGLVGRASAGPAAPGRHLHPIPPRPGRRPPRHPHAPPPGLRPTCASWASISRLAHFTGRHSPAAGGCWGTTIPTPSARPVRCALDLRPAGRVEGDVTPASLVALSRHGRRLSTR